MGLTKEERAALGGSAYDQAYMSDGDLKAAAVFRQKAENGDISWEEANNSVNNIRSTNYGYDGGKDGSEYNYTGGGRKTGSSTGSSSGSGSYSGYGAQINSIANQLMNMNYNQWKQGADYAALKEQYTQNGKMAMQDTVGDVSARTGGLASSYATTAGNQAYNQYMQTLEDAARALYNDEYNRQASNLGVLQSLDNTQYSRYRDAISDRRYDTEWAYKAAQDAIANKYTEAGYTGYLNGSQTLQGKQAELNETSTMAGLTGYMPDGTMTWNAKVDQRKMDDSDRAELLAIAETAAVGGDTSLLKKLFPDVTDAQLAAYVSGLKPVTKSSGGGSGKPSLTWNQVKEEIEAGNTSPAVLSAYEYYMGAPYREEPDESQLTSKGAHIIWNKIVNGEWDYNTAATSIERSRIPEEDKDILLALMGA